MCSSLAVLDTRPYHVCGSLPFRGLALHIFDVFHCSTKVLVLMKSSVSFFFLIACVFGVRPRTYCLIQSYKDLLSWGVFRVNFESQESFRGEEGRGGLGWPGGGGAGSLQGVVSRSLLWGAGRGHRLSSPGHWPGRLSRLLHGPRANEARGILGVVIWRPSCRGEFLEPRMR